MDYKKVGPKVKGLVWICSLIGFPLLVVSASYFLTSDYILEQGFWRFIPSLIPALLLSLIPAILLPMAILRPRWGEVFQGVDARNPVAVGSGIVLVCVALVFFWGKLSNARFPDIEAQEVIKKYLKSPASFDSQSSDIVWENKDKGGYLVKVIYDAQNSFGANIRGCQYVGIRYANGNKYWSTPEECGRLSIEVILAANKELLMGDPEKAR